MLKPRTNGGLGAARNLGFDAADTLWILCLDADKRLLPRCAAVCLTAILDTGAGFAYPRARKFGGDSDTPVTCPFDPLRFAAENDTDFIAIIAKEAWPRLVAMQIQDWKATTRFAAGWLNSDCEVVPQEILHWSNAANFPPRLK